MREAITLDKWILLGLVSVLGFLCSKELARISESIEKLTVSQISLTNFMQDLRLELRQFEVEVRGQKK